MAMKKRLRVMVLLVLSIPVLARLRSITSVAEVLLDTESWLLGGEVENGVGVSADTGCTARPPTLWIPQKGASSRVASTAPLLLAERGGKGVLSDQRENADSEAEVLYPSTTDLRTRMPTVRRFDWTAVGRTGPFSGPGGGEGGGGGALLGEVDLVKYEVICRWVGSLAAPAKGRFVRGPDMRVVKWQRVSLV